MLKLCNYLLPLFCFLSCTFVDFSTLEISTNINETDSFFNNDYIELNFSINIDEKSLRKNLTLKKDNSIIEFELISNSNTFYIRPKENWTKNQNYKISISGTLMTTDNKAYDISFQKGLTYGYPDDLFILKSFINPDIKQNTHALKFFFNKKIDYESFENSFSISPYINTKKDFDETCVTIYPYDKWNSNQTYTWKLNEFKSLDGSIITNPCSQSFIYEYVDALPELLCIKLIDRKDRESQQFNTTDASVTNFKINNIDIHNGIGFCFNKSISISSFSKSFSITPAVRGMFYEDKDKNIIYFIPDNLFEINTTYKINISDGLKDDSNLSLFNSLQYSFTPTNQYLHLSHISVNDSTSLPTTSELTNNIPITNINISEIDKTFINIEFNKPLSQESLNKLDKIISVTPILPFSSPQPQLIGIKINNTKKSITYEFNNFQTSQENYYLYKITIKNTSLFSEHDEPMETELCTLIYSN